MLVLLTNELLGAPQLGKNSCAALADVGPQLKREVFPALHGVRCVHKEQDDLRSAAGRSTLLPELTRMMVLLTPHRLAFGYLCLGRRLV